MTVNRYIGAPIKRVEDLRFLRGHSEYVADLARQGMLHAAVLRSPVAHGRIRAIDTRPALAIRGVHAAITAAEIGAVPRIPLRLQTSPTTEPFRQPVIASDRVRMSANRSRLSSPRARRLPRTEPRQSHFISMSCRSSAIGASKDGTRRCSSKRPAQTSR